MKSPRFVFNGVAQCWSCAHRDGFGEHIVSGYSFLFPYCKVCEADMTEVYDRPCRGYKNDSKQVEMTCLDNTCKEE